LNIWYMSRTEDTFHDDRSSLNCVALANNPSMLVTSRVHHDVIGPYVSLSAVVHVPATYLSAACLRATPSRAKHWIAAQIWGDADARREMTDEAKVNFIVLIIIFVMCWFSNSKRYEDWIMIVVMYVVVGNNLCSYCVFVARNATDGIVTTPAQQTCAKTVMVENRQPNKLV